MSSCAVHPSRTHDGGPCRCLYGGPAPRRPVDNPVDRERPSALRRLAQLLNGGSAGAYGRSPVARRDALPYADTSGPVRPDPLTLITH